MTRNQIDLTGAITKVAAFALVAAAGTLAASFYASTDLASAVCYGAFVSTLLCALGAFSVAHLVPARRQPAMERAPT